MADFLFDYGGLALVILFSFCLLCCFKGQRLRQTTEIDENGNTVVRRHSIRNREGIIIKTKPRSIDPLKEQLEPLEQMESLASDQYDAL